MSIPENLAAILDRIALARKAAIAPAAATQLVAVSKTVDESGIRAALAAGQRVFGENRVQEALAKSRELPPEIEWHLIGPLQSNKVRLALSLFRTIHSIDRLTIAEAVEREAAARGVEVQGFLEVNLGGELSKHGFPPEELADRRAELARDYDHYFVHPEWVPELKERYGLKLLGED